MELMLDAVPPYTPEPYSRDQHLARLWRTCSENGLMPEGGKIYVQGKGKQSSRDLAKHEIDELIELTYDPHFVTTLNEASKA